MKLNGFISKYQSKLAKSVSLEDFTNDCKSLVYSDKEVLLEDIQHLAKALDWVGIKLSPRDAFLIVTTYFRVLQKSEDFSLKDASEIFSKTETLFSKIDRAVYGGQYFFVNEHFEIENGFDYRKQDNDLHYESGNYFIDKTILEGVIKKHFNFIKK